MGEIYEAASEQSVLEVDVLEAGKTGKRKDLSNFHKGQIVIAKRLGQRISKTGLVLCDVSGMQGLVPTQRGPRKDNQ